ncbi:MAG: sensor histidine kinase [Thermoleophilia bacterium]
MSLRKKIIFGFSISAFIITILAAFEYVNFIQVRNEMQFLEVTDSMRNTSLELRRHEKNFFLFPGQAAAESGATRDQLSQLADITENLQSGDPAKIAELKNLVADYGTQFAKIESQLAGVSADFENRKASFGPSQSFVPLAEAYARDAPLFVSGYLRNTEGLSPTDPLVVKLNQLDTSINSLRSTGENILSTSESLDRTARDDADHVIRQSQIAILVFFPLFLLIGLSAMLFISTGVVRRLKTLTVAIDRIGARYTGEAPAQEGKKAGHKDEVDTLVEKFNNMNSQLNTWEIELREKNRELLQSKKLAAIGTLAAGVAHELNNPLNNINISAQVLKKNLSKESEVEVREIINDIVGQTARVKEIVGNLLEFAREREPRLQDVELNALVGNAYRLVSATVDTGNITFALDSEEEKIILRADPAQLERVFVNLFTNAIAAMDGAGQLAVRIEPGENSVTIYVSDTGKGIPEEDRDKVFDPFFTKKDKGTGLGLAIVMNVINKHGGEISVVSQENMGTVFEIELPRKGV